MNQFRLIEEHRSLTDFPLLLHIVPEVHPMDSYEADSDNRKHDRQRDVHRNRSVHFQVKKKEHHQPAGYRNRSNRVHRLSHRQTLEKIVLVLVNVLVYWNHHGSYLLSRISRIGKPASTDGCGSPELHFPLSAESQTGADNAFRAFHAGCGGNHRHAQIEDGKHHLHSNVCAARRECQCR